MNKLFSNKLLAVALLLSLCVSCNQSGSTGPVNFNKQGVSFVVPQGWHISEEDRIDSDGYYVSIEKNGFDSSGLLTLTWFPGDLDAGEGIRIQQSEMQDNFVYKNANLKFDPTLDSDFNGIAALSSNYKMSLLMMPHTGEIGCFKKNNRMFLFMKQESVEDHSKNKAGFEALEKSFSFGN